MADDWPVEKRHRSLDEWAARYGSVIRRFDKFGRILGIEVNVNDISFFQHSRTVEQRNGRAITKWAAMKKHIFCLPALHDLLLTANRRYLQIRKAAGEDTGAIICNLQ